MNLRIRRANYCCFPIQLTCDCNGDTTDSRLTSSSELNPEDMFEITNWRVIIVVVYCSTHTLFMLIVKEVKSRVISETMCVFCDDWTMKCPLFHCHFHWKLKLIWMMFMEIRVIGEQALSENRFLGHFKNFLRPARAERVLHGVALTSYYSNQYFP